MIYMRIYNPLNICDETFLGNYQLVALTRKLINWLNE